MNEQLKKLKLLATHQSNYKYSIMCGLTGSAAALFAKEALQQNNKFYTYIGKLPYGFLISIILRIFFFICMIFCNMKMIEFKIRSFATIGASMTVVTAFVTNYLFNMLYEIILYFKFPSMNQYIGSIFCLVGVYVLKDQIMTDKTVPTKPENNDDIEQNNIEIANNSSFDTHGDSEAEEKKENIKVTKDDRSLEIKVDKGKRLNLKKEKLKIKTQVEIQDNDQPYQLSPKKNSLQSDKNHEKISISDNGNFDNA